MDQDTKNGSSTPNKAQTGTHTSAGKIAAWAVATIVAIVALLPLSLYIPWVQNAVKDVACRYASEATGMSISVDRILIKFPLNTNSESIPLLS